MSLASFFDFTTESSGKKFVEGSFVRSRLLSFAFEVILK